MLVSSPAKRNENVGCQIFACGMRHPSAPPQEPGPNDGENVYDDDDDEEDKNHVRFQNNNRPRNIGGDEADEEEDGVDDEEDDVWAAYAPGNIDTNDWRLTRDSKSWALLATTPPSTPPSAGSVASSNGSISPPGAEPYPSGAHHHHNSSTGGKEKAEDDQSERTADSSNPSSTDDRQQPITKEETKAFKVRFEAEQSRLTQQETLAQAVFSYPHALRDLFCEAHETPHHRAKLDRLVNSVVEVLVHRLKCVLARRKTRSVQAADDLTAEVLQGEHPVNSHSEKYGTVLDEYTEVIRLPPFDPNDFESSVDPETVEIGPKVIEQLKRYVSVMASMHRSSNAFHNFDHAAHVTLSADKLIQRIVKPLVTIRRCDSSLQKQIASDLHHYTFGLATDPVTQLAMVFSALVHDVDHYGVSNAQLVEEQDQVALKYKDKCVQEQNSFDKAWSLLINDKEYSELRTAFFATDAEQQRFRQVVLNVLIATDIFDKELGDQRNQRWSELFNSSDYDTDAENSGDAEVVKDPQPDAAAGPEAPPVKVDPDRKATIVIEFIMQAADVAHCMQDWPVFQKWNRRLFDEVYTAFKSGRSAQDPSKIWYEGELQFIDELIIPLANKLKECGVFGVASDECLNFAMDNRNEWEAQGQVIVQHLVETFNQKAEEEAEKTKPNMSPKKWSSIFRQKNSLPRGS